MNMLENIEKTQKGYENAPARQSRQFFPKHKITLSLIVPESVDEINIFQYNKKCLPAEPEGGGVHYGLPEVWERKRGHAGGD